MKLLFLSKLLFEKTPATFPSDFPLEESVVRLSAQVKRWPFVSPFRRSLVGNVKANKVTLSCFGRGNNSFTPVFYGAFQVQEGVPILEGYFALSRFTRIFQIVWFGFVAFFAVILTITVISGSPISTKPPMPQWQAQLMALAIPYGLLLFNVMLTLVGKWLARNDASFISQSIQHILRPNSVADAPNQAEGGLSSLS